jgi:ATP-dependent RNA/DNA helicase IGHMBP2
MVIRSEPVEVNTVDSFQGQERDIIVVSLARSHGVGFLTDAGRLNVMLTRARHALIIALNPNAVMVSYIYQYHPAVSYTLKRPCILLIA